MELHHLRYFEAVARHGHVTRAARELHIAQPSLSKQIQVLEAELGVALFNRVGRRIELTDAGQLLLPYARRVMRDVAEARAALQQLSDLTSGRVSLGASPTVGTHLLPQALADFNQRYGGIELELHEAGVGSLIALVNEGTVDLAVVSLSMVVDVEKIACTKLLTEDLVLAVAQHHPLASATELRAAELAKTGFILFPVGYELRDRTMQLCRAGGFTPRIVLDGAEMDTVLRFAAAGLGVALVPRLALRGAEGLVGVAVCDVPLTRTLGLIVHRERTLSPAALALQSFLLERLATPESRSAGQ
jgi:LysR family transcriptional regulator, transcription activator of glutamate synthase operon